MLHLCEHCEFETEDKQAYIIHKKQHTQEYVQCDKCKKNIKSRKNLLRHIREIHCDVDSKRFSCLHCNYRTNRKYQLSEHKKTHQKKKKPISESISPSQPVSESISPSQPSNHNVPVRSAFNGKVQERAWFIRGSTDPLGALKEYKNRIRYALFLSLKKSPQKFYIAVKDTVLRKEDFEEAYQTSLQKILKAFDIYIRNGSG